MSLQAQSVELQRGKAMVLRNVSLTVNSGEIVAVLGPNGAGKSSLMRALTNEWYVTRGQVRLDDKPIGDWPIASLARRLAVLPQHSNLDFAFTAEEVVQLSRIPHSTGADRDNDIVHAALACVDATDLAQRLYPELSGGEKQRIHLARVLAQIWPGESHDPRYLLLDEPSASFDLAHQLMMLDALRQFAAQGAGIVFVAHDLNLAAQVADTIVMLKAGQLVASGTPKEVMRSDIVREVFDVEVAITAHPVAATPLVVL